MQKEAKELLSSPAAPSRWYPVGCPQKREICSARKQVVVACTRLYSSIIPMVLADAHLHRGAARELAALLSRATLRVPAQPSHFASIPSRLQTMTAVDHWALTTAHSPCSHPLASGFMASARTQKRYVYDYILYCTHCLRRHQFEKESREKAEFARSSVIKYADKIYIYSQKGRRRYKMRNKMQNN